MTILELVCERVWILKTQAVFVLFEFRWYLYNRRATLHIGRREKTERFVARSAGGAGPVVKSPLRKWPSGRFSYSAAEGVAWKTTRCKACGVRIPLLPPSCQFHSLSV
jgi:hypothetical protein